MTFRVLSSKHAVILFLAAVLVLSCFFSEVTRFSAEETAPIFLTTNFSTQPTGSAVEIAALEDSVDANGGWNSSLQTLYDGIALGQTTVDQLKTAVDSISITSTADAEAVFHWYFELSKFGVQINVTTIETALNATKMLPIAGGLPDDYSNMGTASFTLYNRYDLYAYQWAAELGYETSKWNLTLAYEVFNNSVAAYGKPILCVDSDGKGWGISYGPRYYDETAESIDMYLTFWQLGISDGLTQAEYWWNWENNNLWDTNDSSNGSFYKYALNWTAIECEEGGFDQIIWKLYEADPELANVTNLFTDMETRALSQGWSSPQWSNYVVVHAAGVDNSTVNSQGRLENTIMSWGTMFGLYANMSSLMQDQVQALLDGSAGAAPAWNLTLQSGLYDNSTTMFKMHSDASDSVEATADGAALLMLLSTVPVTGSLAVPLEECSYEDIDNVIDGGVSSINLATRTVTLSVTTPGTFLSMFGTTIFKYKLNSPGVWQLTFTKDWNSIVLETLISPLPNSRTYLGTVDPTPSSTTSSASASSTATLPSSTETITRTFPYQKLTMTEFSTIFITLVTLLVVLALLAVYIRKTKTRR